MEKAPNAKRFAFHENAETLRSFQIVSPKT